MGHTIPPMPPGESRPYILLEEKLRKENIAVKEAWEQYQIVLKLVMPTILPPREPTPPRSRLLRWWC